MAFLYLIDGNSYIYRAFYAIKELSTSDGFPTNAIYGFTNMIMKVLKEKHPDYFAVVFDSPAPTERHRAYEDYKAHRPSMPDELRSQIQPIKDIINAFRIKTIEMEGYEADDVLCTLAKRAEKEGIDVYIVTADKDMNQVLSPKIRTYDTMKDRITDEQHIIKRYGLKPERIPEIIALMGDASDNIPGVPGIGEKTAVKLLKEFGTIGSLIQNHSKIQKPKLREAISENIENIKLSLMLATINTDVPIKMSLSDLKPRVPDWSKLLEFFGSFEFGSLLKLIPGHPEHRGQDDAQYVAVLDRKGLEAAVSSLGGEVAVDTETTSRSPLTSRLVGVSFAGEPDTAYYIPLAHSYSGVPEQLPKNDVLRELAGVFENDGIRKIGHNLKYDMQVLKKEGIEFEGTAFDTMVASYVLNPNKPDHSLEDVSMNLLAARKLSFKEVLGKERKDFSEVPVETAARYSGEDALYALRLKRILEPELKKQGLSGLFHEIEMPLIKVLADMETAGVKIDITSMRDLSRELENELSGLEKRIYFLAGEEFNINSPKQLQEILFEKLGLRTIKKTKTGYSTNVDVLEQLAFEHELPKEILEHRTLSKIKNTYVEALPRLVNPGTGRLHTSFNQTVTATGRLSSSDPNLQNIPIRGDWGRRIREAFIADKGHLLLSADYSQIELRILAHLSGDRTLLEVFSRDGDIHTRTASEIFGVPSGRVTAEMRRRAKTVNFGIVYGISPFGLSQQLGVTPNEARTYIEAYFAKHSGVRDYLDNTIKEASRTGSVSTIFSRKRAVPELKSANRNTRQLGERIAINSPVQGSAADIIKISMINIWNRLKRERLATKIILQVHDELLFEVPDRERDRLSSLVSEEMEGAVVLQVPLKVDIGTGRNWSEAH